MSRDLSETQDARVAANVSQSVVTSQVGGSAYSRETSVVGNAPVGRQFNFGRRHGPRPHGTTSRYKQGCRCVECRAANAAGKLARSRLNPKSKAEREVAYREWHARNPLYATWRGIRFRIFKTTHHAFHRYGGRGIRMHGPWVDDYARFESDVEALLGPRPEGMTIDRIDNDGHYEPGNLRWLPRAEQVKNKTHAHGEGQGLAVLTEASVYAIRRVVALNIFTKQQVATWFGIGRSTLGHVVSRNTWRHVP